MHKLLLLLLIVCCPLLASIDSSKLQTHGVEYGVFEITEPKPVVIHYLIVDPTKVAITLVAGDKCGDAIPTSQLAQGEKILAAINGGFWDFQAFNYAADKALRYIRMLGINLYSAYPVFASKINDQWHAISKERTEVGPALNGVPMARLGILAWNDDGDACIGHCATSFTLEISGTPYPINDVNKPRSSGSLLYTPVFKDKTPSTKDMVDILIRGNTVTAKRPAGGSQVPTNGFVYATTKKLAAEISLGDMVELNIAYLSPDIASDRLSKMTYLRGTTPVLVQKGEIIPSLIDTKSEFCLTLHPRTAIGLFPDGRWLFIVIDGRQRHSAGMSLAELAQFFKEAGCDSAINLDGGGSSTMIVDGTLVNSPSGDTYSLRRGPSMERPVSDAILIMARD